MSTRRALPGWLLLVAVPFLLLILLGRCATADAQVPSAAYLHRDAMLESAWETFGLGAPTATLAGQIHLESAWDPDAQSWVGAQGLAQFMPATARDMARLHPAACAPANPFDPGWAMRCRDRYMASLLRAVRDAATESDRWAMALSAYNGGLGWVRRDQASCLEAPPVCDQWCDPLRWWGFVELTPDPRRAAWAVRENRGYPRRIVCQLGPRYAAAGWGRAVACP